MEYNATLKRIKQLMEQRHWSLYRLAQESDIPYSSLRSLFQKNNHPLIPTLEKICQGFRISLADFFTDSLFPYDDFTPSNEEVEILKEIRKLSSHDRTVLLDLLHILTQIK